MTTTNETPQGYWFGVHWVWLAFGIAMGLFTAAVVYHTLSTVNLMCIEYPNFFRALIFAPIVAGLGGTFAGVTVIAFWWMMGFVYETCKDMRDFAYSEELEHDDDGQ